MHVLFPADSFRPRLPDEAYADEFAAAQSAGLTASLFNFEAFQEGTFAHRGTILPEQPVLYRGWMLSLAEYERLYDFIMALGAKPVTAPQAYADCHHLPGWYPQVTDMTAETRIYPESADVVADLAAAGWNGCFLKDFVKSLSTDGGSVVRELSQIPTVVDRMRKYRGRIEGGICARRLEEYEPGSERRHFVWKGRAYSADGDVPDLVHEIARRIRHPFYSVDVARRTDGVWRLIELGDGQVSDRKHWDCATFFSMLMGATTSP